MKRILFIIICFIYPIMCSEASSSSESTSALEISKKKFACNQCDKSYTRNEALQNHMQIHDTREKTYTCDFKGCDKAFTEEKFLIIHKRSHFRKREHECNECEQAFSYASQLKAHELTHSPSIESMKKHMCSLCKMPFLRKADLNKHLKIHSGERNHICTLCEMSFIQKSDLNAHLKTHDDSKEFRCNWEGCNKSFKTKKQSNAA